MPPPFGRAKKLKTKQQKDGENNRTRAEERSQKAKTRRTKQQKQTRNNRT
jgi:hypothetical protein